MSASKEILKTCPICSTVGKLIVDEDGWRSYEQGALVQRAFPTLSPEDREFLITGMCSPCQDDIFGDPSAETNCEEDE